MSDTTTVWDTALSRGDWQQQGAVLQSGNDLQTAILISLFTDRIANIDDVINDGTNDPRGWVGDVGEQYPIGSRLWLLDRAKQTTETLSNAMAYVTEALQWLIDDDVVIRFDITVQWIRASFLGVQVIAYQHDGTNRAMHFQYAWKGQN